MCRKLSFLIFVVLVLGLVNGALAVNIVWTNDTGNSNWCDSDNWNPETVPDTGDTAIIDATSPDRGPIIGIDCNANVGTIQGPNSAFGHTQVMDVNTSGTVNARTWDWTDGIGTAIINVNGSPSITIGGGSWRAPDDGVGILNISGAPNIIVDGDLRGADGAGSFYINMSGGHVSCLNFKIGDNGGGELNLSGGTLIISNYFIFGGDRGSAPVTINMTGGYMSVGSKFMIPASAGRAGAVEVNLDAGVIDCTEFLHGSTEGGYTDDWHVDIEEGVLKIRGDVRAAIDVNVAAEQITAYDYDGTVVVELIDGNTVVTGLPPDPHTATNPYPPYKSQNVELDVVLSWTPGINAASHDVYFGTDFDDVSDAITLDPEYRGNQEPNSWDPNVIDPCGLDLSTTYYWRIDEKNGSTWKGRVWRFTTRSAIDDANRRLWYKLDEPNGIVAHDSSGYGHHGAVDGPEDLWLPDGGRDGGARQFDDDGPETVIDVPPGVLAEIDDGVTVIVWLKDTYENGDDNWVFNSGTGGENAPYHVYAAVLSEEGDVLFRAGDDTNDVLRADVAAREEWHHFAFVKDEAKGEMCIYFDGDLRESKTGVEDTLVNVRGTAFKIGASSWGNYDYEGKMDDFRVYDYGMSAKEVAELFRGGDVALAWGPEPGDYEEDVPRHVVLSWNAGDYGDSHDVYFGTDWEDVNEAITVSSEFKGNQDPCEWDPPGVLELGRSYYWRIDEVNDSNVDSPWKGHVWSFRVANFLIVDDFESYCTGYGCSNEIYDTWLDGYAANNDTGSEVTLGIDPYEPVHRGKQSMVYVYQSDGGWWGDLAYYSEVERVFSDPCDWTDAGVKVLTVFFYGQRDNDANEQMYVGLEDSSGAGSYADVNYGLYGEDMNDIKKEEWQQWDIALRDFSGVDANNVAKVYIGFGIRGNPNPGGTPGGSGKVYFDNVRLYPPKCILWRLKPAADFTDDCIVDIRDVAEIAKQWLKSDIYFDEYTNPGTVGLVGWWKLNENGGSTANDSSVFDNHGTIIGDYEWVVGYDSNSAVKFKDGKVLVPDAAQLRPAATVSATAWVYYSGDPGGSARVVVKGKDNYEAYCLEVSDEDSATFYVRDVNGTRYFAGSEEGDTYPEDWLHLAGTYDGSTVRFYVDGQVVGTSDEANSILLSQDPCGLAIGNKPDANDRPFKGTIDDVRVYNRALTAAEVAWLASGGTGSIPLMLEENVYLGETPEVINFRDYAVLMESWLEKKYWPE